MPTLRKGTVTSIWCGDIHWSELPPVARSVEEDWLLVQSRYMLQLKRIQDKYRVPIFVAGDLFHQWRVSPNLLSHVIYWCRGMDIWGIPGNHDIPQHNWGELYRSAFWTLVEAGSVKLPTVNDSFPVENLAVYSFPPGFEVKEPRPVNDLCMNVALIHDYIWTSKSGHYGPEANDSQRARAWRSKLIGYDVAVFGDNHKTILINDWKDTQEGKGPTIFNAGTFMRRRSDEREHRPCVGLLYMDGHMEKEYLDVSQDKFLDLGEEQAKIEEATETDLSDYAEILENLHSEKRSYRRAVQLWLKSDEAKKLSSEVRTLMLRALGE